MTTLRSARRANPARAFPGGRRTAQVPSFSPRDYPNLVAWLDWADTSTITASSGAVSQMVSKDAGAKVWTQASGGNKPTTGTRTLNGRNVGDFDGNDFLQYLTNISLAANNGAATFYVVGQADTLATYRSLWTADKSTGGGDRLTQGPRSATATDSSFSWFDVAGGITSALSGTISSLVTNPFILTDIFSGTVAKTLDIYRDGTHVGTQGVFGANAPKTAAANWALGAVDLSDTTHGWDGIIAEWLFYNADHTGAQQANVETYLRRKWGTP